MRHRFFLMPLFLPLFWAGCGGSGSAPSNPPAPPAPLHTALVERLTGTDTYSVYRVKEDGSGWALVTPAGVNARYLASTSDRVIYFENTSSRIKSIRWDGTGDTTLATGLLDVQYRGLLGSRVIYSGRTSLLDGESYTLYSVNIDGTGNVELGPTGTKKVFQALAAGTVAG